MPNKRRRGAPAGRACGRIATASSRPGAARARVVRIGLQKHSVMRRRTSSAWQRNGC
jgi:hypothetical protein